MEKQFLISIDLADFDKLRSDKTFIKIIQLARYINQISFCLQTILDHQKEDKNNPTAMRQYHVGILFIGGIMYNALKFCESLEDDFKNYKAYNNKLIKTLLSKPEAKMINRPEAAKRTRGSGDFQQQIQFNRSQLVFHIDDHPYSDQLSEKNNQTGQYRFTLPEYVFFRSNEGYGFFDLPENLAIYWLIGLHDDEEHEKEVIKNYYNNLSRCAKYFMKYGHKLIEEYVKDKKFRKELR